MRTFLVSILFAGALLAKPQPTLEVVESWRIEGSTLHVTKSADGGKPVELAFEIDMAELTKKLEMKEEAVPGYLRGLDRKLPLLVEYGFHKKPKVVVGIWSITGERLQTQLRLELSVGKDGALAARLVNAGSAVHRVVRPNDGSESGWREPEIYLEREVDGKWERGSKPGRCGLYANDWHRDVVDLKPGETLALEGYLPPAMSFDLPKKGKARLRAVYVYGGGQVGRTKGEKLDPGPMGKTPPFTLVSEPVEVHLG
jgi:hypothetical protein